MAYIHRDELDPFTEKARVNKMKYEQRENSSPLNYDQLAELYRASKSDAVAAIRFDMLSAADKRLAKQVHDVYATGLVKSAKPKLKKSAKDAVKKAEKANKDALRRSFERSLLSPDPWEREAARQALEGM